MFDIQQWLPSWLGGDVRNGVELLRHLDACLGLDAVKAAAGAALSQGQSLAFELSAVPHGHFEAFIERLLGNAPEGLEACVAVHQRPAALEGTQAGWLGLTHGRPAREVRSYVFLRLARGAVSPPLVELLEAAGHVGRVASRQLAMDEVRALLQPWCLAVADSVSDNKRGSGVREASSMASLTLDAQRGACHPLQTLNIEPATDLESWSFARVTVAPRDVVERHVRKAHLQAQSGLPFLAPRDGVFPRAKELESAWLMGETVACHQVSVLLRGPALSVRDGVRMPAEQYRRHGFSCRVTQPAATQQLLEALPWLRDGARQARRMAAQSALLPLSALVPLLPALQRAKTRCAAAGQAGGLWLRDRFGAPCLLDARQSEGNYNTLILGLAGSGCTFLGNAVLGAHLAAGGRAWALRWGSSKIFDGEHGVEDIRLEPENVFSVNPLGGMPDIDAFFDALPVLKAWLHALADLEGEGATDRERAVFEHLVEPVLHSAWRDAGPELGLVRVLAELESHHLDGEMLASRIRKGLHGLAPAWFEGRSALDESARYLSFDTSGFEKLPQEMTLSRTMMALYSIALRRMPRAPAMMLLVDEADVLGSRGAARLLEVVLRRARWSGSQVVLTDHPFSADSRHQHSHHRAMDENCAHKLLLHSKTEYAHGWLERARGQDANALLRQVRTTWQRSSFVWLQEFRGQAEWLELELPPASCTVLGPRGPEYFVYRDARRQGLTSAQALELALQPPKKSASGPAG